MRSSAKQGKIAAALLRLHSDVAHILRSGFARSDFATNADGGYFFSTIQDVKMTLDPACEKWKLTYIQAPGKCEASERSGVYFMPLTTRIIHESGEWIEETMSWPVIGGGNPADVASAVTQARKAALQAMFGLVAEDDGSRMARLFPPGPKSFVNGKEADQPKAEENPF